MLKENRKSYFSEKLKCSQEPKLDSKHKPMLVIFFLSCQDCH